MYSMIVFSSTAPTVAQKYPRAHRGCPQYRWRRWGNSSCNRRDDRPLMYGTSLAGDSCGGAATSLWIGSGEIDPRMMLTSRAWQICRIRSRARSATSPRRTLYRYFVRNCSRRCRIGSTVRAARTKR
jgi:hypothetical protein